MTTRFPGVSEGKFAGLNLADHVQDRPEDVMRNRRSLATQLGARPVFLQQIHGTECVEVDSDSPDGMLADVSTSTQAGVACTVMVADCLPVLLSNGNGSRVVAAHAGWRGLAAGVLPKALRLFAEDDVVLAWLGPCIGSAAFEVGAEVRAAFVQAIGETAVQDHFFPLKDGKYFCDLAGLAKAQLAALRVASVAGNDGTDGWCTVSNPRRWFSHRRDGHTQGGTGRMAACVWIER